MHVYCIQILLKNLVEFRDSRIFYYALYHQTSKESVHCWISVRDRDDDHDQGTVDRLLLASRAAVVTVQINDFIAVIVVRGAGGTTPTTIRIIRMPLNAIQCCLPDTVEARLCGLGDRRAFAARSLREGEVILRNQPTAFALLEEHRSERCSYCLATSRRQSGDNARLFRCSRCQEVKYCSRDCQKLDFPFHKVECREANLLFAKTETMATSEDHNDARLLVRNFLACRQNSGSCCMLDDSLLPTTQCGSDHFENLATGEMLGTAETEQAHRAAKAIWNQRQSLKKTSTMSQIAFPDQLSNVQNQMERDLRRFRVNNFGATDSMVRVCASGVYPLGALLNHSCAPNCLLRYDFGERQPQPPIMEIVAACDIDKGEELTHSYVELVAPTYSRQQKLKVLYGFDCHCHRCYPSSNDNRFFFNLPNSFTAYQPPELIRWILSHYNPFVEQKVGEPFVTFPQEHILRSLGSSRAVATAQDHLEKARFCLLNGSIHDELTALREAVQLLEMAAQESEGSPLHVLCSLELYKARGDRLQSLIVAGDTPGATLECEKLVSFLCLALNHLPNHALLGLQLFTLGDLYEAGGSSTEAKLVFRWAYKVFQVSHGKRDPIANLLAKKADK